MKTQLLEDIGQSATLSLVPSGRVSDSAADKEPHNIAPAPAATPAKPRSASGVWRQKPAGEAMVLATQQADQQSAEPIAAVEAQPVLPGPVHEEAIPPAEPTPAANASPDPLFDFTPGVPTTPAPDLVRRETWFERSGPRFLLWGACVLAGALFIQAGLWLYEERKDASALALVAGELKAEPQVDKAVDKAVGKAVKQRTIAAKEFVLDPDGEMRVMPAAPASSPTPPPRTAPRVPPLVLLEPAPATDTKVAPKAVRERLQEPSKPERVAQRAPERQLARTPVMPAERKTEQDAAMAATLKACRENGYHAAQCVKHRCSMTRYGFVCRGK